VLLVEDDILVRGVAELALRRAGWIVLCADSAEDALEVLKESKCDLMISDISMPGMDGVALTRLVLARQPGLPVILTSGYQRTAADDAPGFGKVAFLTKPYGQAELHATIARIAVGGDSGDSELE
jgi:CheY-like chemotaxis protein